MLSSMNNCVSGSKDFNFFIIAYNMQHNNLSPPPKFFLKFIELSASCLEDMP